MKGLSKHDGKMRRRDLCYFVGRRGSRLTPQEAAAAWYALSSDLEAFGDRDVPKFIDLLAAIRASTITGKRRARS